VAVLDGGSAEENRGGDIWVLDLESRRFERLTSDGTASAPSWSSDGRWLLYSRRLQSGPAAVWRISSRPGGNAEPFFTLAEHVFDPIPNERGDSIVFRTQRGYNRDLYAAAVGDPAGAHALAANASSEHGAALSPDGRWLAYTSNFTGRAQVYLQPLSNSNERWQVSGAAGGSEVRWGADDREVLYRRADSVFAVDLTLEPEVVAGPESFLFAGKYQAAGVDTRFDVTRDGRQFVMVRVAGDSRGTTLHVVMNWFENAMRR
jgi:Tol biopolymer transport system component